jgi:hypothetical protein
MRVCFGVVASWSEFERTSGEMASLGRALLARHQVAYLATVRPDGGPRVHHVCPAIVAGELYLSIGPRSPKLRDLRGDGRYMLHFMCGAEDTEFNVRGAVREMTDPEEQTRVRTSAAQEGLRFTEDEILFQLAIDRADSTRWENFGTPEIRPNRARWIAAEPR